MENASLLDAFAKYWLLLVVLEGGRVGGRFERGRSFGGPRPVVRIVTAEAFFSARSSRLTEESSDERDESSLAACFGFPDRAEGVWRGLEIFSNSRCISSDSSSDDSRKLGRLMENDG